MRKPYLLGALAIVLTCAAGYLLVLSPQAAATAQSRADLEAQQASNNAAAAKIPVLKAQLDNISGQVDELRALSQRVPPSIDLPSLYDEMNAVAADAGAGISIANITVSVPQLVAAPTTTAPSDSPTSEATGDTTEGASSQGSESARGAAPTSVLASYQVNLTVNATPGQAAAFVDALNATRRLNIVRNTAIASSGDSGGTVRVTATLYLQQVDVDGLAAQIESLTAADATQPQAGATDGTSGHRPETEAAPGSRD